MRAAASRQRIPHQVGGRGQSVAAMRAAGGATSHEAMDRRRRPRRRRAGGGQPAEVVAVGRG